MTAKSVLWLALVYLTAGVIARRLSSAPEPQKMTTSTRAARLFRRHDEKMFQAIAAVWADEER